MNFRAILVLLLPWFSFCLCEIAQETKAKLLTDFINYYNLLPNQNFKASEGFLQSVNQIDPTTFNIEVTFSQQSDDVPKLMKCTATVQDVGEKGIAIVNNVKECGELVPQVVTDSTDVSVEDQTEREPIKLENEVQADTAITSGEQFIAIPRDQQATPCIGCASHVNPQAAGVSELANYGIRHLDLHEPTVKHSLDTVIDVERQVQVVNGVRYILTLSVNNNNCTDEVTDSCATTKVCRISILVKPWKTLPSGGKYRAILANNCTEEWLYGDNGEVLPEPTNSPVQKQKDGNSDDDIKAIRNEDVQSQPNQDGLSMEKIKEIEDQIIPYDQVKTSEVVKSSSNSANEISKEIKDHIIEDESVHHHSDGHSDVDTSPSTTSSKPETGNLSPDKKKMIDEMLDFFDFSGFKPKTQDEVVSRVKRNYDHDLEVLSRAEDFYDLKKSITNAKYIYEMAQVIVDYLNVMDMEVKNRALKNVLKAEEEEDNGKHFVYIQLQIVIPCETANCEPKETETKICNGVIDSTNRNSPQILNSFCYIDTKEMDALDKVKEVPIDDRVLIRLAKEALGKMESESADLNALIINKIVSANTRVASGRVTKISMIIEHLNCNKSVPLVFRSNCSVLDYLGSSICEVIVHEKHWLKERQIIYTCTERPVDMTISKFKKNANITVDDPKIMEILQEALHYLEMQSNEKNQLKLVRVNKISTQVITGFLIDIEFTIGYTNCTNTNDLEAQLISNCDLITAELLRNCKAQIWDKSWIVEGRQMDVSCDDDTKTKNTRRKRSLPFVGGQMELNVNDPKYISLAEESLQKYLQDNSNSHPHRVVQLDKVTTQIVAGTLTRIDFTATQSDVVGGSSISCHSKIWQKPWENFKNIDVSCVQKRGKRDIIAGGQNTKDVNDPKSISLAEESLQKYLQDNSNSHPHRVVQLDKVTTQVVAGISTEIDFTATQSDVVGGSSISCHSKIWEKPWANFKNIDVSCVQKRGKRDIITGGETTKDVNDPKYISLAEESLQKYLQDNSNSHPHRVMQLNKVITQVVAGTLTEIDFTATRSDVVRGSSISCHSKIWAKPWANFKNIDVSCVQKRGKRDIITGAETTKDVNDPKYISLAEESLQKYLQDNSNSHPHRVMQLNKVITQVVAGTLTEIDFTATRSDVVRGSSISCHSKIWAKPWANFKNIDVSCVQKRGKRDIITGAETTKDVNDPKYISLAEESLQKYLQDNSNSHPHRVMQLNKVTTQVVAGIFTEIDFTATQSDVVGGSSISCHSKIWQKPWKKFKNIDVSCNMDHKRRKRQTFTRHGQEIDRDPNDRKYLLLAFKSMNMYLNSIGDKRHYTVIKVAKVTTQAVAGTLIRIFFVIRPHGEPEGAVTTCLSKIWERPWLEKESIKIKCVQDDIRDSLRILENIKIEEAQNAAKYLVLRNKVKDPKEPKYLQLAKESLQKYLLNSGSQQPYEVVHVEQVTTTVENGTITRLNFVVLPVNTSISDVIICYSEVREHPLNEKKEIEVSCQLDSQDLKKNLPGKAITVNADNFKYLQLANDSLQKYLKDTANSGSYKVTRLDRVTVHLDAGLRTKIQFEAASIDSPDNTMNCFSNIFEQTWLNKRELEVICDNDDLTSSRDKRTVVQGHDLSKYRNVEKEQDVTKPEFLLMAEQSLKKYSKKVGKLHKVHKVNHVTKRVVSGIIYKIDFSALPTECHYNGSTERFCEVIANSTVNCNAEIWDQPWKRKKRIKVNCYPDEVDYDHISGEVTEESNGNVIPTFKLQQARMMEESKVYSLAKEAVEQYMDYSNEQYFHAITRIVSSNDHLASDGRIINMIRFSISPTICFKNQSTDSIDNCELKEPRVEILCEAKIVEQSWLKVGKDVGVKCNDLQSKKRKYGNRSKRQTGIGQIDEDDNEMDEDTTYYYADRAVQHVNERTDANNLYKLITIHSIQTSVQMKTTVVKMYIEIAETYCLRHQTDIDLYNCEEMEGLNHRLCLARVYPSPDDELVVRHVSVVCDDNDVDFNAVTGLNVPELLRISIEMLEKVPENHFKLVHQGEPQVIPSLDTKSPIKINFVVAITNCTKEVDLIKNPFQCYLDTTVPSRSCYSYIWLETKTRTIHYIDVKCNDETGRQKRSLLDIAKNNSDSENIKELVTAALEKLEMVSLHRYKQRVLHINSHSSKITSGKVTTIDFDVGYTSCLKYEWVENVTSCDFIEHLPRRHCVAQIWERLWLKNGRNIDVSCEDDETPLEAHIEFESAEMAMQLAREALKHIEAKYPHPKKQKVVRIFSLEKQAVAGIHYRMKVEVGFTDCAALSDQTDCKLENDLMLNKFCRVNVWVRPWTDHPPNFRVYCDFQEGATADMYHQVQAEQLFYNFLATYNPSYANDHTELEKRFNIFRGNIRKIHEMNVHEKGTATYGVTRFTDLSYKEFRARYMGFNMSMQHEVPMKRADIPSEKLPQNFDWRDFDAVTEVKDQGLCGSCWAFSVTGNIEGQWKMQSGQLVSLSEQQLLDCDKIDDGCSGGLPANAYRVIEQLGGLERETDYPYEGESDKCLINTNHTKVQISGSVNITSNETGMAQWLVHNGPISIGINANPMQFYMGGIAHPWYKYCDRTDLDHGALIVGFGVEEYPLFHKRLPYWVVKNSWGPSWGEQGYYRVYRGDGSCGVNQMPTSAVI